MSKTLNDTYLYRKYEKYEKTLIEAIMQGDVVDKNIDSFKKVVYEVKQRQISNNLVKVLNSENVILLLPKNPMTKAFKVFTARDIKGDRKLKVFIDCSNVIIRDENSGEYFVNNVDVLIAYLVNAMVNLIYYTDEKRIIMNANISKLGAEVFSRLFVFVLNNLYKINLNPGAKEKALYLSSLYYLINIEDLDYGSDSPRNISKKIAGISNREEELIRYKIDEDSLLNIKEFIELVADTLKLDKLTLDLFVDRWMYLYGTGTVFGLELFPSFSSIITDAYVGCYMNNQKTIEKVVDRTMVEYTKAILQIGADSI